MVVVRQIMNSLIILLKLKIEDSMKQYLSLNELKEEWRTSATRHKVGIVVLALVIIGVKLFAPAERQIRIKPAYIPAQFHTDVVPLLATDSCAIFELSQELPGCVRNGPAAR